MFMCSRMCHVNSVLLLFAMHKTAMLHTVKSLVIVAPETLMGTYSHVLAGFGPELPSTGIEADVLAAQPTDACLPLTNADRIRGKVALALRGNCDFFEKCLNAQRAHAIACIVYDNVNSTELVTMSGPEDTGADVDIPALFVSKMVGQSLHDTRIVLNSTGELVDDGLAHELITHDTLASPFRSLLSECRTEILGGDEIAQIQIVLDAMQGTTTVLDKLGSTFSPDKQYCTSLEGPGCMSIKRQMDAIDSDSLQFSGAGSNINLDNSALRNLGQKLQRALENADASGIDMSSPAAFESVMEKVMQQVITATSNDEDIEPHGDLLTAETASIFCKYILLA